jgi:Protein of unknown function (DUF1553)/Protein of unknown function (DUF1549)/Planctomycete cytochrome C/Concanavalin A-like lectin/glucanases superfamily
MLQVNGVDRKALLTWAGIGLVFFGGGVVLQAVETNASSFSREQVQFYEKKVQPILEQNCYKCHSHEAEKIKGDFVLDSRGGLLKGGETGPAVVPGDAERSLLIKAVQHVDEDLQMPPKKKLADADIATLTEWVKLGAPYGENHIGSATAQKGRRGTTEDRNWWSFQPVRKVTVPEVKDDGWSRNPIDHFIFAKLNAEELTPSPAAQPRALIRRVYFDLIGLPPSADDVERFAADPSPGAYEKVIEKLLNSQQYGEKWARHWLDLVRFAESDGYKSDSFRPNAWRYRDYVIRSFNEDKPYNRFLMEQVAADELWPDEPDALVGVGFLRLWIYEYNQRNVKSQWSTILNDLTDVTGDALMGLGIQCARCHDHKFDPILQRDYYRLQAFYAPIAPRDDLPLATPAQLAAYRAQLAKWEEATAEIRSKIKAIEQPVRDKTARAAIDKLPKDIQAIMSKPTSERTPYEQQIHDLAYRQVTDEFEKLDGKFKGAEKEKLDALQKELEQFDALKSKALPDAMLVTDIGRTAPPVTLPKDKTQTPIDPGLLTLLSESPARIESIPNAPNSTGRRTALAKWMGSADNQFTTRVIVNRIWQHHFGRGLAATPSDFGHLGDTPSHPELLDWLASYFVEHNWSIKEMHRLIVLSATYRQAASVDSTMQTSENKGGARSDVLAKAKTVDPENRWLWRQNPRRLEGDQIRDAMLWASGELDSTLGGPSVEASKPRRTIYTKWMRNSHDPLLEAFDPPDAYLSTPQRNVTTTPMQSLVMINGPYVLRRAEALAKRITASHFKGDIDRVTAAYMLVYGREPSAAESNDGATFLSEQAKRIAQAGAVAKAATDSMPGRVGSAAAFKPAGGQTRLQVPDNSLMPQYDFTAEAFIVLQSIHEDVEPRTIVSRWDGRKDQPGWSLGVTGKGSAAPRTIVLELIGDPAEDGAGGYEAISSGLKIELNKPYFVAVSVRIGDTSETGVTFFLRQLSADAEMRVAHVDHKVTSNHQSNLALVIGGRDPDKGQVWDGLIDDVRLSRLALKPEELLLTREGSNESTVGFWRFEEPDFFKDSSPNGHNIRPEIAPAANADPQTAALIDFCHALLNSNEFLYVD